MKYFGILFLFLSTYVYADFPVFENYKVPVYKGKQAKLILNGKTKLYKTSFRALQRENVNFAGHYVVNFVGCGAGCALGIGLNVKTGSTLFLPFGSTSGCELKDEYVDQDYEYQADSRLIISTGLHDGENKCSVKYFIENKGKFSLIIKEYL